jgi:uncharacterized membrane protein
VSQLAVITFDDEESAGKAMANLRQVEKAGALKINDTAVIVKDKQGKVHTKNEVSSASETGAVVGGIIGGMLTFMFPPAGAAVGAAAGAAIGALTNEGVDGNFVREVQADMEPGTSALFIVARGGDRAAVTAALEPFKGTLRQTTLDTDAEEALKRALQ